MDYFAPSAAELPDWELDHLKTPSPVTPLGIRRVGEAGTIPPAAAPIANDLRNYNGSINRWWPAIPFWVWRATTDGQERGR